MRTLYGLYASPWTEKARWALDHHSVTYVFHEHVPLLGEPFLRQKAKRAGAKATVPLLEDDREVIVGSPEIARHAERIGRGSPLFPSSADDDVQRFSELSDRITDVGRAVVIQRLKGNHAAQRELLPRFVPDMVRGIAAPMTSMAARFLASKYEVDVDLDTQIAGTLRPALLEVRRALGGRSTLLDAFSWADIAIASALTAVRPHHAASMGPATVATWTQDELAREFDDLLMWRDAVYKNYR